MCVAKNLLMERQQPVLIFSGEFLLKHHHHETKSLTDNTCLIILSPTVIHLPTIKLWVFHALLLSPICTSHNQNKFRQNEIAQTLIRINKNKDFHGWMFLFPFFDLQMMCHCNCTYVFHAQSKLQPSNLTNKHNHATHLPQIVYISANRSELSACSALTHCRQIVVAVNLLCHVY
jgi:hypothetical protein